MSAPSHSEQGEASLEVKYSVLFWQQKSTTKNCWGPQCASAYGLFGALFGALSSAPRSQGGVKND